MSNNIPSGKDDTKPVADDQKKDTVAYESFQKALNEKKLAQANVLEMQSKLDAYEKTQKELEETKLNEKGEYKKLVELREQELNETKLKLQESEDKSKGYKENLQDTWKLQAFYEELPGQIKRHEYLNFVDLESIVVDPETRQVDKASIQNVVSKFMEEHADLVKTRQFNGLPGDASNSTARKLDIESWKSLSLKDKKANWSRRPEL